MTAAAWFPEPHVCHTSGGLHVPCWCDIEADHYGTGLTPPVVVDGPSIDTYPEEQAMADEQATDGGLDSAEDVRRAMEAIQTVANILDGLPMETQKRILVWAADRIRFTE